MISISEERRAIVRSINLVLYQWHSIKLNNLGELGELGELGATLALLGQIKTKANFNAAGPKRRKPNPPAIAA
jgi:hypothetical protein